MKSPVRPKEPAVVYTLTATCIWGAHLTAPCVRVLELRDDQTLTALHYAIIDAVKFDDDHLHEFYAARTERARARYSLQASEDPFEHSMLQSLAGRFGLPLRPVDPTVAAAEAWAARLRTLGDPPLKAVFPLPNKLKLFYWFDFGDDWKFEIKKERRVQSVVARAKYPRVVGRTGPNPEQYPNW